jgi:hypothetical protein
MPGVGKPGRKEQSRDLSEEFSVDKHWPPKCPWINHSHFGAGVPRQHLFDLGLGTWGFPMMAAH